MSNIKCESCHFHDNCVSKNLFAYCAFSDIDEDKTQMVAAELESEEDSSYLYEFIFEACEYFSSAGYICNSSEIFSVISDIHESVQQLDTVTGILRRDHIHRLQGLHHPRCHITQISDRRRTQI